MLPYRTEYKGYLKDQNLNLSFINILYSGWYGGLLYSANYF